MGEPGPEALFRRARALQWATIVFNGLEFAVTVSLGVAAQSLALVAFGLDSLVELFASLVVVWRLGGIEAEEAAAHRRRDRRALELVALAFWALAAYLVVAGVRSLVLAVEPESSPVGAAYLAFAATAMFALAREKKRVGTALGDEPVLAEASLTRLDGFLACGILAALLLNMGLGWWWADPAAGLLVAGVAAREALAVRPARWP